MARDLSPESLAAARLLIVDDEPVNVRLLETSLRRWGFENITSTTDPREVPFLCEDIQPDLVLTDLHMPNMDGYQLLAVLSEMTSQDSHLPVIVLTADITQEAKKRALELGAKDFLSKPFDLTEVELRIKNLLESRFLHLELKNHNENLEELLQERTEKLWDAVTRLERSERELRVSREETIRRLAVAAEFRDDETARHVYRMSEYCVLLARKLGEDPLRCETIRVASQLHDVGKIGIPDNILLKPGPLTSRERSIMEKHAQIGERILGGSRSELLELAATIALTHHERVDGTGYPNRLAGDAIPVEGRIAAIADVFDALTTNRVYRGAFAVPDAVQIMREQAGAHFDMGLLELFLESIDEALDVRARYENATDLAPLGASA